MDYFWKNYQYLCAKNGESVYKAAEACGVKGTGTVSYWKKGSKPNSENLDSICRHFDVKSYDLLYKDLEALENAAQATKVAADDPLYNAILKLTPHQRTLVQGFIAGLRANSDIPL